MSRPKEKTYPTLSGKVQGDVLVVDLPEEEITKIACPTCGKGFENALALRAHHRVHEEKITCVVCGKSVGYIAKHLRTKHGVQVKRTRDALLWMETNGPRLTTRTPKPAKQAASTDDLTAALELLNNTIEGLTRLRKDLMSIRALQEENEELRARLELVQEAMKA